MLFFWFEVWGLEVGGGVPLLLLDGVMGAWFRVHTAGFRVRVLVFKGLKASVLGFEG
jgi:hypothetical protein